MLKYIGGKDYEFIVGVSRGWLHSHTQGAAGQRNCVLRGSAQTNYASSKRATIYSRNDKPSYSNNETEISFEGSTTTFKQGPSKAFRSVKLPWTLEGGPCVGALIPRLDSSAKPFPITVLIQDDACLTPPRPQTSPRRLLRHGQGPVPLK
jgi:hypothetical protein